ncbi:MAG: hypothetical protein R2781_02585 [Flavobacteriaceae bacterium]
MKKDFKFKLFDGNCATFKAVIMTQTSSKKKHADFQSAYRRSLNFSHTSKKDRLVLNELGELVLRPSTSEDE